MPPADALPRPRLDAAPPSSRNAVRGGIVAALSSQPVAPPPAAAGAPDAAPAAPVAAVQPPPARGWKPLLRAAARRALLAAKPPLAPLLHRFQMRVRTAVDDSGLAARMAGVEQSLAALSARTDAEEAASRQDAADIKRLLAEAARRLEAAGREAAAESARRFDAAAANAAAAAGAAADAARRDEAARRRLDEIQERLDAVQGGVAALSQAVHSHAARRPPVPVGGEFLVYTPDGVLLVPAEDLRFLAVIADGGVLEAGTRRVLAALLRPGGVFLDVGANVGTMTLLGARMVGPSGRVFAVEPTPRVAALLRRSMVVNDVADRVAVADCAAGERESEALLHLEEVMSHNTLFPQDGAPEGRGTVRVRVRPSDDLVPAGLPVDVAKIDAEGAELEVWRGMRRILAESPNLAAVLEFGPSHLARVGVTPEAWLQEVQTPGFEPYMIDDMTGVCRPATLSALAGVFSANILLLRPGAASRHPDLVFA